MTLALRLLAALMLLTGLALPAQAQRLISTLSEQEISIDSTFAGESLTLFGNVEPEIGASDNSVEGPFDIIITVQGPSSERTVWRKSRVFGVWLNTQGIRFPNVPALYHVLTTRPLFDTISPEVQEEYQIGLGPQAIPAADADPDLKGAFTQELIRLMTESRRFGQNDRFVTFLSPTFYSAQLVLPADVPNGTYLAKTFLVKDGEILDERAERFFVRTTGIERLLSNSARDYPLLYGIACVLLALFTGWIGAVAFRR